MASNAENNYNNLDHEFSKYILEACRAKYCHKEFCVIRSENFFTSFHDCTNKIIRFFLKIIQATEELAGWFSIKRRSVQPYLSLLQTLPRG